MAEDKFVYSVENFSVQQWPSEMCDGCQKPMKDCLIIRVKEPKVITSKLVHYECLTNWLSAHKIQF